MTSTSSSSAMNSIAVSRVWIFGGASLIASSAEWVRMFVFCFSRVTLTIMSSGRLFSPMTMPS